MSLSRCVHLQLWKIEMALPVASAHDVSLCLPTQYLHVIKSSLDRSVNRRGGSCLCRTGWWVFVGMSTCSNLDMPDMWRNETVDWCCQTLFAEYFQLVILLNHVFIFVYIKMGMISVTDPKTSNLTIWISEASVISHVPPQAWCLPLLKRVAVAGDGMRM